MKIALIIAIFTLLSLSLEAKDAPKVVEKKTNISVQAKGRVAVKKFARVTKYKWTGNKMANGMYPRPGYVAVSDRSIKLGGLIWIGYTRYIIGDYTDLWVHDKSKANGYDFTVDIYTEESLAEALNFGFEEHKIALLEKL